MAVPSLTAKLQCGQDDQRGGRDCPGPGILLFEVQILKRAQVCCKRTQFRHLWFQRENKHAASWAAVTGDSLREVSPGQGWGHTGPPWGQ